MTSAPGTRGVVLVLEDDPGISRLQCSHLERAGYRTIAAHSIAEARATLGQQGVDLLILDYQLGATENGLEFYRSLHADGIDVPAILVTAFTDEARIIEAMRSGVRDFVPKTPNFFELVAPTVDRVMQQVHQDKRLVEAEAASRAKDNFLATLSHELRTPLTPVVALVSALRVDERLPHDVRSDLEIVHRNISLEARLIDDLLDLTRIVQGKLELRVERTDLRHILEHAVKTIWDAEVSGMGIVCHCDFDEGPHELNVDPARITQVFWNLLRNALKFTLLGGEVRVRSYRKESDGEQCMCVEVSDTGIGIDPAVLPRIFGAFEQGDRRITRRFGGLGLGLAISKAIVELHKGTITASSDGLGKGANFTVCLPFDGGHEVHPPAPPKERSHVPPPVHAAGAHILLVEDHLDTADVLSRILRRAGFRVSVASTVARGIALVEEAAEQVDESGRPLQVELLVSDLGLPDGTGIDLMRKLRSAHPIPAIALSGFGMDDDIRRALDAGFARHITKPVDVQSLLGAIRELLAER